MGLFFFLYFALINKNIEVKNRLGRNNYLFHGYLMIRNVNYLIISSSKHLDIFLFT